MSGIIKYIMEREKFFKILKLIQSECEEVNRNAEKNSEGNELIYEVLQFSDLSKKADIAWKIARFYNENWTGNRDFMHIPDFNQTVQNCLNYPIIIAREKGKDEILGITTIKYDENSEENLDPYFPEEDAKYFSVTGILVKKDNPHRGIGKKIYEIAIRGVHKYSEEHSDTRLMCVIDCRNSHSLRALSSAVENIRNSQDLGYNKELPAYIVGYYELRDEKEQKLQEAPTLVVEVNLQDTDVENEDKENNLVYHSKDGEELFNSLLTSLKEAFKRYGLKSPIIKPDGDLGMVYYYSLDEKCKANKTWIQSNGTELGNDRIPEKHIPGENFIGPIPNINLGDAR